MSTIKICEFSDTLTNRNQRQGDGKKTAIEFRTRYLKELDNDSWWDSPNESIIIDFIGVKKLSPSFADEAFAYFTRYAPPEKIKSKIKFTNMTTVQERILDMELKDAYDHIKA